MDLKALPKAELHCHLDGILDPAMAREIRRADPAFPIDPARFEQAYPVEGLDRFWNWFRFLDPLDRRLTWYRPVIGRYIERLKAQNVLYSEVMIAGSEVPHDPAQAVDEVGVFREWVNGCESGQIQVEFLVAWGRNRPPEVIEERARVALALYEAGLVVGVALAGPEQGYPVQPFHQTFAWLHEAGLGIEIHAGEWCGPESVWDALAYGHPDRLGHGVSLFQDPRLLDVVRERHIHIEMCPTSNLKTGSVSCIAEHPIGIARDLGLDFSVNADDPGAFECSIGSEYALLVDRLGFDEADLQRVYRCALAARFQPRLRAGLGPESLVHGGALIGTDTGRAARV